MANRYWIGGTGDWSDNTNHWSTSSGGSGGASIPTSSDDVFINSSSGFGSGGTITQDGAVAATFNNFTSNSGHTYTIDCGSFQFLVYGSLLLENTLTFTNISSFSLLAVSTGKTITTNGVDLKDLYCNGVGGGWTLQDNLVITGQFYMDNGTFDANDHNVTADYFSFYADTGFTPTVVMGSGTWESTSGPLYISDNNGEVVTVTPETSTISLLVQAQLFCTSDSGSILSKTLNNVTIDSGGVGPAEICGDFTINSLSVMDTPVLYFQAECTTIINSISISANTIVSSKDTNFNNAPHSDASGVELVTNGSFTGNASGWSLTNGWSYNSNNIIFTAPGTYPQDAIQTFSITSARQYKFTATIGGTTGEVSLLFGYSGGAVGQNISAGEGSVSIYLFLDPDNVYDGILLRASSDFDGTVDSVSVQEMIPRQHTLSKSSGTVVCDYLNISNSNATGGATWYAGSHSTDTTNNDGWIFTDPPASTNHSFSLMGVGS